MSALPSPLVSVIIPAWNAAATIDATLDSVRAQTCTNIEIIVIDDGSTDNTFALAEAQAANDLRITVKSIANGGVAAARNHGIALTAAPFVGPIDADDIWAPDWLEQALARFDVAGKSCVLVYGGYAAIDGDDQILRRVIPALEGDVRAAIAARNFIGNGSSAVMQRKALIEAGGYDVSLRTAGAQGCEDHMLYFRMALLGSFGTVAGTPIGYRQLPGAMSRDYAQMARSHDLCADAFAALWPDGAAVIEQGRHEYKQWLLGRAIADGALTDLLTLFRSAWQSQPRRTPATLARAAIKALVGTITSRPRERFGQVVASPASTSDRAVNPSA